jgi:hypothetical protein
MDGIDMVSVLRIVLFPAIQDKEGGSLHLIIGYSSWGPILRYAIGRLHHLNIFTEHLKPKIYISIASPHLGTRRKGKSALNNLHHYFESVRTAVSRGYEIWRAFTTFDVYWSKWNISHSPRSLHYSHTDSTTIFDMTLVHYTTSSITSTNPFRRHLSKPVDEEVRYTSKQIYSMFQTW